MAKRFLKSTISVVLYMFGVSLISSLLNMFKVDTSNNRVALVVLARTVISQY